MTKVKNQKKSTSSSDEHQMKELKEQNKNLQMQIQVLSDLSNLREESYYRQQKLIIIERIAQAEERQAKALEDSLPEESEDEDLDEDEDLGNDLDDDLED